MITILFYKALLVTGLDIFIVYKYYINRQIYLKWHSLKDHNVLYFNI